MSLTLTRRDLFAFAGASVALLSACSSTPPGRNALSTEDNPVLRAGSSSPVLADAPGAPPAVTSTSVSVPANTGEPHTNVPSSSAPLSTASPPSTELPVTTSPVTAVQLPPGAQPVPLEGQETYLQLGSIEIPSIKVHAPLGEGVTLTNLNHGPGHWPGTALPGEVGNAVIGGHRVSHSHPFRDLDKLTAGDTVKMSVAAGEFSYAVTGTEIILPTDVQVMEQTSSFDAILFACTPKGETTHRIVVHLRLEPPPT